MKNFLLIDTYKVGAPGYKMAVRERDEIMGMFEYSESLDKYYINNIMVDDEDFVYLKNWTENAILGSRTFEIGGIVFVCVIC